MHFSIFYELARGVYVLEPSDSATAPVVDFEKWRAIFSKRKDRLGRQRTGGKDVTDAVIVKLKDFQKVTD